MRSFTHLLLGAAGAAVVHAIAIPQEQPKVAMPNFPVGQPNISLTDTVPVAPSVNSSVTAAQPSSALVEATLDMDLPLFSEEDFVFLDKLLEQPITLNETELAKRSETDLQDLGALDSDSTDLWVSKKMDAWLLVFIQKVNIWKNGDTGIPLINSTNFLGDFWVATNEEKDVWACQSITKSCEVTQSTEDLWRTGLGKQNVYRHRFVRRAISKWFYNMKEGYYLLDWAQTSSQTQIRSIRENFVAAEQAKPADPMSLILPILSVLGVFVPGLGPAVAVIGSIVAVGSAIAARDENDQDILPKAPQISVGEEEAKTLKWVSDVLSDSQQSADNLEKRARDRSNAVVSSINDYMGRPRANAMPQVEIQKAALAATTSNSIGDRLAKLEKSVFKDPFEKDVKELSGKAKDILTGAATIIKGVKALYPQLRTGPVNTWAAWDARTNDGLRKFADSIADSFAATITTWNPSIQNAPGSSDQQISAGGMSKVLMGGGIFDTGRPTDVTKTKTTLMDFFKKMVLMEVLKAQSVYFWRQEFPTLDSCQAWWRNQYTEQKLVLKHSHPQCVEMKGQNKWEIHLMRKPFTYGGNAGMPRYKRQWGGYMAQSQAYQSNLALKLPEVEGNRFSIAQPVSYEYEEQSAFFDKWKDSTLTTVQIGDSGKNTWLTTEDIYQASLACQATGNPFSNPSASTRSDYYKAPYLEQFNPTRADLNPLCLFNIPILDINDGNLGQWCRTNLGTYKVQANGNDASWTQGNNVCSVFKDWSALGDAGVCTNMYGKFTGTSPQPGCELHDRGYKKF